MTRAAHSLSAYSYRFGTIPHGVPAEVGAGHFRKIGYKFRNSIGTAYRPGILPFEGMSESHFELAMLMSSSWASFISDPDPNAWAGRPGNGSVWSKYASDNPTNLVFDANVTSHIEVNDFRKEGIELVLLNSSIVVYVVMLSHIHKALL